MYLFSCFIYVKVGLFIAESGRRYHVYPMMLCFKFDSNWDFYRPTEASILEVIMMKYVNMTKFIPIIYHSDGLCFIHNASL